MFTFRQVMDHNYLVSSNAGITTKQINYQFTNLDNKVSLGALFDQYRFVAARIHVVPNANAVGVTTAGTVDYQPVYSVVDYDDSIAPASQAAMRAYDTCIELSPGESCMRTIEPRADVASVIAVAAVSTTTVPSPWVDVAVTTLPHYGFKLLTPQADVAQTSLQTWNVWSEVWVQCRSVR